MKTEAKEGNELKTDYTSMHYYLEYTCSMSQFSNLIGYL